MAAQPKTYQAIMVSSTFTDLKEHRAQVIEAIQHHGYRPEVMEYSGAAIGPDVLDKSLAMVADSAAYILVIGHRYGQTPIDPQHNAEGRSITELEFDAAIKLGRPVLVFIIADDHPVTKGSWETEPEKIAKLTAFIAKAKRKDPCDPTCQIERIWETYSSAENLGKRAAIAIGKMVREMLPPSAIPPETQAATQRALEAALADEARKRSISEEALKSLAAKVAGNVDNIETAKRELERTIDQFIEIRDRAAQGSNLGDLIDETMRRIAALNEQGKFAEGAAEAESAYDTIQARKDELNAAELRAINAAIDQHKLAFDAPSVARWIERRIAAQTGTISATALFAEIEPLRDLALARGLWFEAETALALARRAVELAEPGRETGAAQNWLGMVASDRGVRLGGADGVGLLEEAVTAYRAALRVSTLADLPVDWAATQNNLATALQAQGARLGGADGVGLLEEAVTAYRAALRVHTEAELPAEWAMTQCNLGNALQAQGARLGGAEGVGLLEEAVTAYRAAQRVHTEAELPADWAMTQNNLGNALTTQGERLGGAEGVTLLQEAVLAYRAALRVRTEADLPADWATTQNNLGTVLQTQGECLGGAEGVTLLQEAVLAYRAALRVRTEAELPTDWATTQNNLGGALQMQGKRLGGAARVILLEQAVTAYRAALRVFTEANLPVMWAIPRENMAIVLESLAVAEPDRAATHLREAEAAVLDALRIYSPEHMPYDHGTATKLLTRIRTRLASLNT